MQDAVDALRRLKDEADTIKAREELDRLEGNPPVHPRPRLNLRPATGDHPGITDATDRLNSYVDSLTDLARKH